MEKQLEQEKPRETEKKVRKDQGKKPEIRKVKRRSGKKPEIRKVKRRLRKRT